LGTILPFGSCAAKHKFSSSHLIGEVRLQLQQGKENQVVCARQGATSKIVDRPARQLPDSGEIRRAEDQEVDSDE